MRRRFALIAALFALTCTRAAAGTPLFGYALRQLRFSPNGRYVLAQDDYRVAVFTVSPLAALFQAPAELAGDAQFTPDSLQITFVSSLARADRQALFGQGRVLLVRSAPRVERWRVADGTPVGLTEIKGLSCETEQLSPDGQTLACDDTEGTLKVIDVASGEVAFEKKKFVKLIPLYNYNPDGYADIPNGQFLGDVGQASFDFSPDGHLLIARPNGGEGNAVVWDLGGRSIVKLAGMLTKIAYKFCVFLAPHRLLVPEPLYRASHGLVEARIVDTSSGKTLSRLKLPPGPLFRAADPGFVVIRPFGKHAIPGDPNATRTAAEELSTGQVIVSETPPLDVLGRYYVAEPSAGLVGLYERGKGLRATVPLRNK